MAEGCSPHFFAIFRTAFFFCKMRGICSAQLALQLVVLLWAETVMGLQADQILKD